MCLLGTIDSILLKAKGNLLAFLFLFARSKNNCSNQFLNWLQELSTGQFHLDWFDSLLYSYQ